MTKAGLELSWSDGIRWCRWAGFVGEEAANDIKKLYVGKRVPDEYRKGGAANPIKYTWGRKAAEQGDAAVERRQRIERTESVGRAARG